MSEYNIFDMIEAMMGKRCRLETTDGSVRVESVVSVDYRKIDLKADGDEVEVEYPVTLFFDEGQVDGVDFHTLRSLEVLE